MADRAGNSLHYHGFGDSRYGHRHVFLHINHEYDDQPPPDNSADESAEPGASKASTGGAS